MLKLAIVLKQLRESRNLTILKLAEMTGLGNGTIGDIESGKSNGSRKSLDKIVKALQLTTDEKDKLYSAFLGREYKSFGDKRIENLDKKELTQYEKAMNEASMFFNDEEIDEEDKQKLLLALNEVFFRSKEINKKKYAHKNKKDLEKDK